MMTTITQDKVTRMIPTRTNILARRFGPPFSSPQTSCRINLSTSVITFFLCPTWTLREVRGTLGLIVFFFEALCSSSEESSKSFLSKPSGSASEVASDTPQDSLYDKMSFSCRLSDGLPRRSNAAPMWGLTSSEMIREFNFIFKNYQFYQEFLSLQHRTQVYW